MRPVHVVGVGLGPRDLPPRLDRIIERAQVLAGGNRQLDMFPDHHGKRLPLSGGLKPWLDILETAAKDSDVAVLASGDPGFFGIAARLVERLGRENVTIHPNVSVVQHAFARLGMPWHGARVVSLHGRGGQDLFNALCRYDLLAVFTDPQHTPAWLADNLVERGQEGWRLHVLEDLGTATEKISALSPSQAHETEFSPLNLVVMERTVQPEPILFGAPEVAYQHQGGLITKSEVRAMILARLRLLPEHTLWDLGAGSGSVGIEASRLLTRGRVIAVEKKPDRVEDIRANQARFGAANLEVVEGKLPGALDGLPDPDRVFLGGGGPLAAEIIAAAAPRLAPGGMLAASAVRLESVEEIRKALAGQDLDVEITQLQVSKSGGLTGGLYLKALNPIWLLSGEKPT